MNSDNIVLKQESYSGLTTDPSGLTALQFDTNNISIYKDFEQLQITLGVAAYGPSVTYDNDYSGSINESYATYNNRFWMWVNATPNSGVTPVNGSDWQEAFPSILAHEKNKDEYLGKGTVNEVSAVEVASLLQASQSIVSSYLNISESSGSNDFLTFSTPALDAPATMDNGDEIKITAIFRNSTAPPSDGFGAYFFFDNAEYVHPSSSTPTYGNSFFQLPYNRALLKCELLIHKISATEAYIIVKQVISDNLGGLPTTYGEEAYANIALDWASFNSIKVQTFITAGGEITLEYLKIDKLIQ